MAGTVLKVYDNEGKELNFGDKVAFCMENVNRTSWFYDLRTHGGYKFRALFSSTNPNSKVNYTGYEVLYDYRKDGKLTCFRAIKL